MIKFLENKYVYEMVIPIDDGDFMYRFVFNNLLPICYCQIQLPTHRINDTGTSPTQEGLAHLLGKLGVCMYVML
jgi:hypothetical protein